MQFEEEEVEQEDLDELKEGSDSEAESLDDQADDIEEEEPESDTKRQLPKRKILGRPNVSGIWLTVFGAFVIILLGGLASYYYYTFQRQGVSSEKSVKSVWTDVADSTQKLTDAYGRMQKFQDITDRTNTSLSVALDQTNRTVRDGGFDLQNQLGLDVRAATVGSKLVGFLDDYSKYLAELRRVIDHADTIVEVKDLDTLKDLAKRAEDGYDELLAANGGFLKEQIPRSVFDMAGGLSDMLAKMIEENGSLDDKNKALKQSADSTVTKFVQAWQDKDIDAMSANLTSGAKSDLIPAALENSVDVTGLSITDTTVADDSSKITIKGDLKTQPPGSEGVIEKWQFVLLPTGDKWLIDSWKKV